MKVGIGIPNTVPGVTGPQLLDWARRADEAGFSSLATIGALDYPGYEELTVLAAAAAVTERIHLVPNVLIAPVRSAAELAKQAATVQQISSGRLTLGLGVGWRESDFALAGRDHGTRGKDFDAQLADLKRAWEGESILEGARAVAPSPGQGGVPILIGGGGDAAIRRTVEHGIGWTGGGMPPEAIAPFVQRVRAAWHEAGREGEPYCVGLAYFSLGDTEDVSRAYLSDYYQPMGAETAGYIAGSALRSPEAIQGALAAFADAGLDELMLDPTVPDVAQVDLLAEVVF